MEEPERRLMCLWLAKKKAKCIFQTSQIPDHINPSSSHLGPKVLAEQLERDFVAHL